MPTLIVFDFDWSMADQDSDRWICEVLSPKIRRKMEDLEHQVQWTDLVAEALRDLHSEGKTREQIEDALKAIPFHPAMKRGIKNLKERGPEKTTFFCLSNANSVFIDTILTHHSLKSTFTEIITNPGSWAASGLLVLKRRIDPSGPQHTCTVGCSPNMCKGDELEAFLERHPDQKFDGIFYIGDGSNDFCPILRLRSQDTALVRRDRGLQRRVEKEGKQAGLKCQVKYWEGAWEIEEIFNAL